MARYIDIESVGIGKAKREQFIVPEYADGWNHALEIFESEPTADVEEVKRGHWITNPRGFCFCSECLTSGSPYWKRCPICEAKMDGGKEE